MGCRAGSLPISENVTLKTTVSKAKVQPSVLTRTKHAVDVELIIPRLRNNKDTHLDYLRHLKESMETIRNIVEEAKVVRPLDRFIVSACRYTQHSQELLEYAIGTCPQGSQQRAKQLAHTPLIRKKQDTITKPSNRQDRTSVAGVFEGYTVNAFIGLETLARSLRASDFNGMNPWGGNAAGYGEAQTRVRNVNQGQARPGQARTAQENGVALDAEQLLFLAGGPNNTFDDDVDEQPVQDLALNVDNVFQAKDCDAFDSDVDEAPTAQTMFMANLSSADPITDEARPSYDSDILSEVRDHDQYLDDTCAYQEEHVMHDSVQLDHIVDLYADHTSISNMIPYDQYVKDIDMSVVHNNASSILNDTFMMMYDNMCESIAPSVSNSSRNAVVKNSLTAELATYRE
nr:hypothetical protein [Tanacetum cinerariifolium]